CRSAGIQVKMITGDHAATARAIGERLGLAAEVNAISGAQIESMSDEALQRIVADTEIFARASPEHKMRLVRALQARGEVVAMTGDGVNDAPALKRADVGVAMGRNGTEAAKEASRKLLEGARNEGLRFSKKFLMENPRLYGWEGLRLKASLFDGNVKNGEIADQGVVLRWPTLLIYFKTEDGIQWRFYSIEDETYQRTTMLLREILRERALAQVQNGNGGSRPRSKLPWILLEPALHPDPLPPTGEEVGGGEVVSFEFLGQGEDGKDGKRWMPKIEGSFSSRGLNGEATLPPTPWGALFSVGTYDANPYGALQFPFLGSLLPIDLRLEGRPTHIGLFPSIRTVNRQSADTE
ncbi:MAG: HAD-IC family P-type ATPase, partial [Candidatus Methylomirabilales bacterium]